MTKDWKTSVLLAGVLELPIALVGHHADAVQGLALPGDFARLVNGFPRVTWGSPKEILRSNYKLRRQGQSFHLRMYSHRIRVTVPQDMREVWVHRSWISQDNTDEILAVQSDGKQIWSSDEDGSLAGPIPVHGGEELEITSLLKSPLDYRTIPPPPLRVWPVVRKALMEIRDRTLPIRS